MFQTIYEQFETYALGVLQFYTTDLTEIDRNTCRTLAEKDFGFWAVRPAGTHMMCLPVITPETDVRAALRTTQRFLDKAEAVATTSPESLWYDFVCTGPQVGHVKDTTAQKAIADIRARRDALQALTIMCQAA